MLGWNEIVQDYIIRYSNQIQKTTQPLRERFKIEYFTYHRIDNSGKYTVLVDRPDWAEHYVQDQFYLHDPYLRNNDVYKSGFCTFGTHGDEVYNNKVMKTAKDKFQLDQSVMWIDKQPEYTEFFGYCANRNARLDKLYINHSWVLKSFAIYFKKEMEPLLRKMEEGADHLYHLKGPDFHCKDLIYPDLSPTTLIDYLSDLGQGAGISKLMALTKREKQCVKLLIEGKSAKETAFALKLSFRTVESYLEHVKNKLSCFSKEEIRLMAKHSKELGLFG